jgi:hypothetical protein
MARSPSVPGGNDSGGGGGSGKHMKSRFFNGARGMTRPITPGTMLHMKSPESKDRASPHKALSSFKTYGHIKGVLMGKRLTRDGVTNGVKNRREGGGFSKRSEEENNDDTNGVTVVVPLLGSMNPDADWSNFSAAGAGGDDFGSWDADAVPMDVDGHVENIYYDDFRPSSRSSSSSRPKSARRRGKKKKRTTRPKSAGNRGRQQTKK